MSPKDASMEEISLAAQALTRGAIVVIPTETVYGLACHALDEEAVRRIFEIKHRPLDNPIIVHVSSLEEGEKLGSWNDEARELARLFWPGPLTLVLPKRPHVPDVVTGGLDTVALRCPAHPVAVALLQAAGIPLAAPSANVFTELSPTATRHLRKEIVGQVFAVLEGGDCQVGIESTVLDCSTSPFTILRPGSIHSEHIEAALHRKLGAKSMKRRRSPGQYKKHYAPRGHVTLVDRLAREQAGLTFEPPENERQIQLPRDPALYAARLYDCLFLCDSWGLAQIAIELPPIETEWAAVHDRLERAAGKGKT